MINDENCKVYGNHIKSDIYSTAISMIYMCYPNVTIRKEDRNKDDDEKVSIMRRMMTEIVENKISKDYPNFSQLLK